MTHIQIGHEMATDDDLKVIRLTIGTMVSVLLELDDRVVKAMAASEAGSAKPSKTAAKGGKGKAKASRRPKGRRTARKSKSTSKKSKKSKNVVLRAEAVVVNGDAIDLAIPKGWPVDRTKSGRFWVRVPLTGARRPVAKSDCDADRMVTKVRIIRRIMRKDDWQQPKVVAEGDTFVPGYRVTLKEGDAS